MILKRGSLLISYIKALAYHESKQIKEELGEPIVCNKHVGHAESQVKRILGVDQHMEWFIVWLISRMEYARHQTDVKHQRIQIENK